MVKNVVATKEMVQGKRKNEFREAMNQVTSPSDDDDDVHTHTHHRTRN
jgi:hypothetical protein